MLLTNPSPTYPKIQFLQISPYYWVWATGVAVATTGSWDGLDIRLAGRVIICIGVTLVSDNGDPVLIWGFPFTAVTVIGDKVVVEFEADFESWAWTDGDDKMAEVGVFGVEEFVSFVIKIV